MFLYRGDVESPAVLCSPDKMCSVLTRWLKSLEDYVKQLVSVSPLHKVLPSLLTPPPPFSPISHNVLATVTCLATLCAELGIYCGAGSANASPNKSCDEPSDATTWSGDLSGAWDIGSCDSLEIFIGRYAEVLDFPRIRCLLAQQEWVVREKGWRALNRMDGECNRFSRHYFNLSFCCRFIPRHVSSKLPLRSGIVVSINVSACCSFKGRRLFPPGLAPGGGMVVLLF